MTDAAPIATKLAGTRIGGTKNTPAAWAALRDTRDDLLVKSDWTQMPDVPLATDVKASWATYRQALRDLTKAPHMAQVVWPTPPGQSPPAATAQAA